MRILIALLLTAIALWRTDGFSPELIESPLLSTPDTGSTQWEWPIRFRYLGRGRQMFAFESEDGKYVLKFFNRHNLEVPWYLKLPISLPYWQKQRERWTEKMRIYPESYRLAIAYLPQETGLLQVHMGSSSVSYPVVEIRDRPSATYLVDLNHVPFVLQKKGSGSFLKALLTAREEGNLNQVLDAFLAFHAKRIHCLVGDQDRDIKRNYCWEGDHPLYIDPARFFYDPTLQDSERIQWEWEKVTYRLRDWLSQQIPEAVPLLDAKRKDLL
ncbi:MAG: hypothetical protein KGJ02_06070 [Verrucomicrobiota bacterium]|nr:hypothetical protein [Verrucomicrobiota bacterium]